MLETCFTIQLTEEAKLLEEAMREGIPKPVLARSLLIKAIREKVLKRAIKEYTSGKCSLGYAAKIAGLSIREFISELVKRGITLKYSPNELEEDLKTAEELTRIKTL